MKIQISEKIRESWHYQVCSLKQNKCLYFRTKFQVLIKILKVVSSAPSYLKSNTKKISQSKVNIFIWLFILFQTLFGLQKSVSVYFDTFYALW